MIFYHLRFAGSPPPSLFRAPMMRLPPCAVADSDAAAMMSLLAAALFSQRLCWRHALTLLPFSPLLCHATPCRVMLAAPPPPCRRRFSLMLRCRCHAIDFFFHTLAARVDTPRRAIDADAAFARFAYAVAAAPFHADFSSMPCRYAMLLSPHHHAFC